MLLILILCAACEKGFVEQEDEPQVENGKVKVSFTVSGYETTAFAKPSQASTAQRENVEVGDVCTRISFALFDQKGEKVTSKNQEKTDSDFGRITVAVEKGTYQLVVIAHSSTEGNATISSPEKITFKNNKLTDTFYKYETIEISESSTFDVVLQRAVAMFRLTILDATPSDVAQMKFFYTGGSSTFDAVTGYGCVNSRQTEVRTVASAAHKGESTYELYTFPHSDGKALHMNVYALSAQNDTLKTRELTDIPVERNKITAFSTSFFGESPGGGRSLYITVDSEWSGNIKYEE